MEFFIFLVTVVLLFTLFKLVKCERRVNDLEFYIDSVQKAVSDFKSDAVTCDAAE